MTAVENTTEIFVLIVLPPYLLLHECPHYLLLFCMTEEDHT